MPDYQDKPLTPEPKGADPDWWHYVIQTFGRKDAERKDGVSQGPNIQGPLSFSDALALTHKLADEEPLSDIATLSIQSDNGDIRQVSM